MNAIPVPEYERKHNLIGLAISLLFHVLVLYLFFFAMAWERQDPPPFEGGYSIGVNLGNSDEGFGEVQTEEAPGEKTPAEASQTPPAEAEPQQPGPAPASQGENLITSNQGEETSLKPAPEPVRPAPVSPVTPPPAPAPAKPSVNQNSLYNPGGGGSSEGNDPGKTGDKGKAGGTLDNRGIYSGSGTGGGNLDMPGWQWDSPPVVRDESEEKGRIVFQVKIDENGEVISVQVLEKNVSPALVRKYQKEVETLTFSRRAGGNSGSGATGKITFNIKSN